MFCIDLSQSSNPWPPRDPNMPHEEEPSTEFILPDSPWTYNNGNFNPELLSTNSARLDTPRRRRSQNGEDHSSLPPYHPDYQERESHSLEYSSDDADEEYWEAPRGKTLVRRGSEGYEVRPAGREDMLKRYLEQIGETPRRYHRYIPEPDSESEDDVPLTQTIVSRTSGANI